MSLPGIDFRLGRSWGRVQLKKSLLWWGFEHMLSDLGDSRASRWTTVAPINQSRHKYGRRCARNINAWIHEENINWYALKIVLNYFSEIVFNYADDLWYENGGWSFVWKWQWIDLECGKDKLPYKCVFVKMERRMYSLSKESFPRQNVINMRVCQDGASKCSLCKRIPFHDLILLCIWC